MKSSDIGKTKQFCVSHHNGRKVSFCFFFFTHQECDEWIYNQRKKLSNSMSWLKVKSEGEGVKKLQYLSIIISLHRSNTPEWAKTKTVRFAGTEKRAERKMIKITSSAIIRRVILKFLTLSRKISTHVHCMTVGFPNWFLRLGRSSLPQRTVSKHPPFFLAAQIKSTVECSFSFLCDSLLLRQSFHRK